MDLKLFGILITSGLPIIWAENPCAVGFEPHPLVVAERAAHVVNNSACAAACMKKTCKAFVFYPEARRCELFVPHPGTQCKKSKEAERLPGPPQGHTWSEYLEKARTKWNSKPDIHGGKCNTGGRVIKNLGWGKDVDSVSLDKCQALCEKDKDCVGVSHLPYGGRIMDNIAVEMSIGVAQNIGHNLLGFLVHGHGSQHCETGPLSPPSLKQCIDPVFHNNTCTLCYRVVTDCRQFSNGEDCTVFRTDATDGGVYLRPKVECPSRASTDSCSGDASCPIIAKGKCHGDACLCDDDKAPCAQATMGPEYVHGRCTHNSRCMDVPKNEPGKCVSKGEFCRIDEHFIDPKALEIARLQSLLLVQNLMSSLKSWLTHLKPRDYPLVAKSIITMKQSAKDLDERGVPPAILFLKVFGIYQCYVDMLTSSSTHRGLEFTQCEVDATLQMVTYLSHIYYAADDSLREKLDDFAKSKEIEKFKITLDRLGDASQKSHSAREIDKIEQADTKTEKAADKAGVDLEKSDTLTMGDFDLDTSRGCHHIYNHIQSTVAKALKGQEDLIIVTGSLVITKAVENSLNVEHWASKQPFLDIMRPNGEGQKKLEMMITQHLEEGTHMLENMLTIANQQMHLLLSGISADKLHHAGEETCTTYPDHNPTPFCNRLDHTEPYLVDVQFRDVHFTECRVKDAIRQYMNIADQKDFHHVMKSHPVCETSVRDLACLRALPTCQDPCENLMPCKTSCENINTCAKTLGLQEPYDCETQCICMHGCYDLLETSMLDKEVGECTQVCSDKLRKKHADDFWYNLNNHDSIKTRVEKENIQCQEECKYSPQQRVNMLCNHRETQQEAAAQDAKFELLVVPEATAMESTESNLAAFLALAAIASLVLSGFVVARCMPRRLSAYSQVEPLPLEESQEPLTGE